MKSIAEQMGDITGQLKKTFGVPVTYNGIEITAIHDDGETNVRETGQGSRDRDYFTVFLDDVPSPETNDEIVYAGEKYRVIRKTTKDEYAVQLEAERNASIFPRRR